MRDERFRVTISLRLNALIATCSASAGCSKGATMVAAVNEGIRFYCAAAELLAERVRAQREAGAGRRKASVMNTVVTLPAHVVQAASRLASAAGGLAMKPTIEAALRYGMTSMERRGRRGAWRCADPVERHNATIARARLRGRTDGHRERKKEGSSAKS